jgi:hypothetical protein
LTLAEPQTRSQPGDAEQPGRLVLVPAGVLSPGPRVPALPGQLIAVVGGKVGAHVPQLRVEAVQSAVPGIRQES